MGLARYALRRLAVSAGLLAILSVVVFVGVTLLPGDPAAARLGPTATAEQVADARHRLGLDRPLLTRYGEWAGRMLRGDLGVSLLSGRPVRELLDERLANSALLAGLTLLLVVPLSLALGLWAGWRRGGPVDRLVSVGSVLLVAVPEYIVASLLVLVVAVWLRWLPAVSVIPVGESPLTRPDALALPVLSLLMLSLAYSVRLVRAAAAAAARSPHVETAQLNGVGGAALVRHGVLPAVLPGAVQVWCVMAAGLVGGAVLVERVYGYPGLGEVLVSSVQAGDLPVAQAVAVLLGGGVLVALTVADVAVVALTPQLRTRW
jgi:peptide/nickel transport system permease protein